jgi:glycerol-3-phosphate dehydrogenase
MNIAVLGSGNGGCAIAFDCAAHGHKVSLFDFEQFPESIKAVQDNGGIYCEGVLEGFQQVAYAGHEIEKALDGADIIYAVGPAYGNSIPEQMIFIQHLIQTKMKEDLSEYHKLKNERNNLHSPLPSVCISGSV